MIDVRIYTTNYCGYCTAAKALLGARGITYEEVDVSGDGDQRHWLVEQTGQRTVPQIFLGGTPIGGFTELRALDRSGELAKIMAGEQAVSSVLGDT